MSALITGCVGYVGSHIALDLLDRGEEIAKIDNLAPDFVKNLPSHEFF